MDDEDHSAMTGEAGIVADPPSFGLWLLASLFSWCLLAVAVVSLIRSM